MCTLVAAASNIGNDLLYIYVCCRGGWQIEGSYIECVCRHFAKGEVVTSKRILAQNRTLHKLNITIIITINKSMFMRWLLLYCVDAI